MWVSLSVANVGFAILFLWIGIEERREGGLQGKSWQPNRFLLGSVRQKGKIFERSNSRFVIEYKTSVQTPKKIFRGLFPTRTQLKFDFRYFRVCWLPTLKGREESLKCKLLRRRKIINFGNYDLQPKNKRQTHSRPHFFSDKALSERNWLWICWVEGEQNSRQLARISSPVG